MSDLTEVLDSCQKVDVVFFYGPPYVGKTIFYWRHLMKTHIRVSLKEEFRSNSQQTLRQVVFSRCVIPLRQGKKVVIDDGNGSYNCRQSILGIIQNKVPGCHAALIKFVAEYGEMQVEWARESARAERLLLHRMVDVTTESNSLHDTWFGGNSQGTGDADDPSEEEGFLIKSTKSPLIVQLSYKLEVPGLLIQWEALTSFLGTNKKANLQIVANILQAWYKYNPCGRIVLICDETTSPGVNPIESHNRLCQMMGQLVALLPDVPIYAHAVEDPRATGTSGVPPHPATIAFLQRLHHLILAQTLYIYHTLPHASMASAAGVAHVRSSQAFSHPDLVVGEHACHGAVKIPAILKYLNIVPPLNDEWQSEAKIPLYDVAREAESGLYTEAIGDGRRLYIASKDKECLDKYQKLYNDNATSTEETQSRIEELCRKAAVDIREKEGSLGPKTPRFKHYKSSRDIPKWMRPRSEGKKPSFVKRASSSSLSDGEITGRKLRRKSSTCSTMYVMTECELLDTALKILEEANSPVEDPEGQRYRSTAKEEMNTSSHLELDKKPSPKEDKKLSAVSDQSTIAFKAHRRISPQAPVIHHQTDSDVQKVDIHDKSKQPSGLKSLARLEKESAMCSSPSGHQNHTNAERFKPDLNILDESFFEETVASRPLPRLRKTKDTLSPEHRKVLPRRKEFEADTSILDGIW